MKQSATLEMGDIFVVSTRPCSRLIGPLDETYFIKRYQTHPDKEDTITYEETGGQPWVDYSLVVTYKVAYDGSIIELSRSAKP